jgi:DNA-binding CsgD family transcriptional regulator
MPTTTPNPLRGEILRLAHVGLDLHEFARDAARVLRRAVPFDGVAVVALDPATALPVNKWKDNFLSDRAGWRLAEIEHHESDVNKFSQLAAAGRRAASMSQATGGKLDRSRRYRELIRPHGFGDELRVACVGDTGTWGQIVMHRERCAPNFTARDVELLASVSGALAEGLQRVSLQRDLSGDAGGPDPGLLLIDDEDGIELSDAAAAAWLDELRDTGRWGRLPLAVMAVAERARAIASGHSDVAATARVRTASGRWVMARGSVLRNGTRSRTAVTLAPARAPELAELIAGAYGLTARERRVTELVAQGLPTAAIAARLHLSTYTVQDHLKAIFEKLDVSTRGQLVARLFLDHYQVDGRLRDPRQGEPLPAACCNVSTGRRPSQGNGRSG